MGYVDVHSLAAGVLMIPYLFWGVYTLQQRLKYHAEFSPVVEAITLAGLFVFYAFEMNLLKPWQGNHPGLYSVALMGLFASGAALYGPLVMSFVSHVLVDVFMPAGEDTVQEPRLTAGEAFERRGDYRGALNEYMAQGKLFPKDATVAVRIADNLAKLDRIEEAATWFERGVANLTSAEKCLTITNRLCEIYCRRLDRPDDALKLLTSFLERYPGTEYDGSVRARIDRLKRKPSSDTGKRGGKKSPGI